jgi:hypothetical protein
VLLTGPSAYLVLLSLPEDNDSKERKPKRGQGRKSGSLKQATKEKDYVQHRGQFCGDRVCHNALTPLPQDLTVDDNDPTEGLYHFVQATNCQHGVITDVFNNPDSSEHKLINALHDMTMLTNAAAPTILCCDICSPSLLDHTRPGMKPHTDHARQVTKKEVSEALFDLIKDWQDDVYKHNYKYSSLQAGNVLPDVAIAKLAHLKLPLTAFAIQAVLTNAWP